MRHWATPLIGKPWSFGATGPDAFDCWGFFRHVQRERFGIELPMVDMVEDNPLSHARTISGHPERINWEQVPRPSEGDAVLMARSAHPVHIGVWIEANGTSGVLHCMQHSGVVFMTPAGLRGAGWGRLTYYRHRT